MATMTKAARKAERLQNITRRVCAAMAEVNGNPPDVSDVIAFIQKWDRMAESLRKRWENECSYEWADTEAYRNGTERAEKRLVASVRETGLHSYLQTDPRGAALYVDSKPMTDQTYTNAICVCLD